MFIIFNYFNQTKLCSVNEITVSDNRDGKPVLKFRAVGDDNGAYELRLPKNEAKIIPMSKEKNTFTIKCNSLFNDTVSIIDAPVVKGIEEAKQSAYELTRKEYLDILKRIAMNGGTIDLSKYDTEVLRYYIEEYNLDEVLTTGYNGFSVSEANANSEDCDYFDDDDDTVDFSLLADIDGLDLGEPEDDDYPYESMYDENDEQDEENIVIPEMYDDPGANPALWDELDY